MSVERQDLELTLVHPNQRRARNHEWAQQSRSDSRRSKDDGLESKVR